ncbi:hypothetical protein [Luteimicrobium subarcticum]|uniref:Uncharacterized protein n=1 Tax=Luteimicrobium subarcticum TaxID=620910 RepID=A0A2M8WJB6_9MICO|nr:hypothetical protein [Luteimicrobium subarcticum]PJI91019.1 hypothetical protein CLV34_2278 [Luteimicrobium subarcticum]
MTTTPDGEWSTSEIISSEEGLTAETGGATPGNGPEGVDLDESADEVAERGAEVAEESGRVTSPGPDSTDAGGVAQELPEGTGRTPGPGPEETDVERG